MNNDIVTLKKLEEKVGHALAFKMEGDRCVELDLTSKDCFHYGLIRHHSHTEKQEILSLICRLASLKSLNLRRNKVFHLPPAFQELRELEFLNLGSNCLGTIPAELSSFRRLEYLHLGNNGLGEIPEFMGGFAQLEYLALHKNVKIKSINALAGLKQLKHLNLHYLNLHRLPPFIWEFKNLITLTVWNISQLPNDLAKLSNLEFFSDCGAPGLRALPDAITTMPKLRMMRLFQNNLESLPENFGALENLEQLSLYQNQLFQLPESFARLKKLKKLNLGWNRFKFVPSCLAECTALEWLGLFENPLKHAESMSFPLTTRVARVWPFTTLPENHQPLWT